MIKTWDDEDNLEGIRPTSLNVELMRGDQVIQTIALSAENNWTAEVTGLPAYDGEALIAYTWREPNVAGYTLTESRTEGNVTTLTNTHLSEKVSVTVSKVWDDDNDAAGRRTESLRVTLHSSVAGMADTSYNLNEQNGWTLTVRNLPRYYQGREIAYTWSEQSVLGYTQSAETTGNVTVFTNTCRLTVPQKPESISYLGSPDPENPLAEPALPGNRMALYILEEYDTPLGVEIMINHAGDAYE